MAQISFTSAPTPFSPIDKIALLPWGDLVEDFLDGIGVSLEDFSSKMTGGWLFGYVEALALHGIRSSIFCFSARAERTVHTVHQATGAEIVLLRPPAAYRRLRRHMNDPYGWNAEAMFGASTKFSRQGWRLAHVVAPYLATSVRVLCREIRRARCRAILCQEYEAPRFDAAVAVGGLLRIPVFATFQGGSWHRSRLERHLRSLTLRRCAGLIIGSSLEAARVREQYGTPPERIASIFNPLDLSVWRPGSRQDARRKLGIPDTTRMAVWHGRIEIRTKGLDLLLEAWRSVCSLRSERDILLMLVGSGPDANQLDEEIRRTAVPHVRWIQEYVLDRASIRQYLSAADVYVLPSRREGLPVALLEAMACGLPVVAASAPGVADILNEGEQSGGIVVPAGDATSLAKHLGHCLDDETWGAMLGARARGRVERAFSLESIGAQLHDLIQSGQGR